MTSVRMCSTALTSLTGDLRGDSLRDLARGAVVEKYGELRLAEEVDESRRQDQARCGEPARRIPLLERSQLRDPVTAHADISTKRRPTGPVDDAATEEEHVAIDCLCTSGFPSGSGTCERECQPAQDDQSLDGERRPLPIVKVSDVRFAHLSDRLPEFEARFDDMLRPPEWIAMAISYR